MLKKLSVFAIFLLAVQAHAATNKPFVTLGLGQSSYSDGCEIAVGDCDDTGIAFRLGAGMPLTPIYSAELTYFNHGDATTRFSNGNIFDNYTMQADTFALQIAASLNVAAKFNVYGKAGFALTQAEASNTYGDINGAQFTDRTDDNVTGAILSLGAQFKPMPRLMLDLQLDHLPSAIDLKDVGLEADITTISAGFKYQF